MVDRRMPILSLDNLGNDWLRFLGEDVNLFDQRILMCENFSGFEELVCVKQHCLRLRNARQCFDVVDTLEVVW